MQALQQRFWSRVTWPKRKVTPKTAPESRLYFSRHFLKCNNSPFLRSVTSDCRQPWCVCECLESWHRQLISKAICVFASVFARVWECVCVFLCVCVYLHSCVRACAHAFARASEFISSVCLFVSGSVFLFSQQWFMQLHRPPYCIS